MAGKKKIVSDLLKYSGIFILCGWMFFLGVMVGRGTAPVKFDTAGFQKKLAAVFQMEQVKDKLSKKTDLGFYEMLKKPVSDVKTGVHSRKQKEILPLALKVKKRTTESNDKEAGVHESIIKKSRKALSIAMLGKKGVDRFKTWNGNSNADDFRRDESINQSKQDKKIHVSHQKDVCQSDLKRADKKISRRNRSNKNDVWNKNGVNNSKSGAGSGSELNYVSSKTITYTIQVAACRNLDDAFKLMKSLKNRGYSPYRTMGKKGNKIWHRVRIGTFTDIKSAAAFQHKLESDKIKGIIIQKDN